MGRWGGVESGKESVGGAGNKKPPAIAEAI